MTLTCACMAWTAAPRGAPRLSGSLSSQTPEALGFPRVGQREGWMHCCRNDPRAQAVLPAPPGVAATKLQNRKFYPMVCSTAAKSSMKVIRSCASITSLQYLCCYRLRQLRPNSGDTLEGLPLPPGLKQVLRHKLGWVLSMSCGRRKPPTPSPKDTANASGPETRHYQRKRCRRTELLSP